MAQRLTTEAEGITKEKSLLFWTYLSTQYTFESQKAKIITEHPSKLGVVLEDLSVFIWKPRELHLLGNWQVSFRIVFHIPTSIMWNFYKCHCDFIQNRVKKGRKMKKKSLPQTAFTWIGYIVIHEVGWASDCQIFNFIWVYSNYRNIIFQAKTNAEYLVTLHTKKST